MIEFCVVLVLLESFKMLQITVHYILDTNVQWNLVITCYNEVLGTMKMTLVYQVSHYIRVKKQNKYLKTWDQQEFCYIRPLYNEVPLYNLL